MHFLFGAAAVLNASGLSFFFYYPRAIDIVFIDPTLDVLVWMVSVVGLSIQVVWRSSGRQRFVQISLALAAVMLSIALWLFLGHGVLGTVGVVALFAVGTAEFVTLIVGSKSDVGPARGVLASRSLIYLLGSLAVIESSSAVHYILASFDPATRIGSMDAGVELQLSYAPYALIPLLYVAFLFSWAWVPLVRRFLPKITIPGNPSITSTGDSPVTGSSLGKLFETLLDPRFILALAFAIFIGYYPYFQNPQWLVGTDANWRYLNPLLRMNGYGVVGGFLQSLDEFHPVALALLYGIQLIFQTTASEVVRFTPLFLVVALGLATWWFLARGKSLSLGLIVLALAVMSVATTVGFYASILSNWMTLLVWVVFFAYVAYRGDEGFRFLDLIVLLVLSTLILFIHPWTWGVFAATVLVAAIAALFQERRKGLRGATILVLVIAIDVAAALLGLMFLHGSTASGFAYAIRLYAFPFENPSTLLFFWTSLTYLTRIWSPFFSPLYLSISILGVFSLWSFDLTPWRRRLILAWICVSAIGSVLVAPIDFNPAQPNTVQSELWRLLFLTPFQLAAPFGITWLTQIPRRLLKGEKGRLGLSGVAGSIHVIWLVAIFVIGILMAWTPAGDVWLRLSLLLLFLPAMTAILLRRAGGLEAKFLSAIILAIFLLVAFNSTTRGLSQLLIDPHNCDRC